MRVGLAVLALLVIGCSDSPTSPSQSLSYVDFRLDANSCAPLAPFGSVLTFTFFVDGAAVGSSSLGIGTTSPPFAVSPGTHVVSARITNTNIVWPNLNVTVPMGGTLTIVLPCP